MNLRNSVQAKIMIFFEFAIDGFGDPVKLKEKLSV